MTLRLGFFQYERSHPQNAPHVGMCLLLQDARKAGHTVDAALVHVGAVGELVARIRERAYDLVALDSIFTVDVIARLKRECPEVPILVGGTNALSLFLFSPADYAIVGPARSAMPLFLEGLPAGTLPGAVPNLYVRQADGSIDQSGVHEPWSLGECDPFDPDFEWEYLGPPDRESGANTRFASIVPEFGCAFQRDALSSDVYRELPREGMGAVLASLSLTPRVRVGVDQLLENTRGCAFCAFRYQTYTIERAEATAERALGQLRSLHDRYGITEFSLQSENPFRFLPRLVEKIGRSGLRVRTLLVRTFPAILARSPDTVREGFEVAVRAGLRLELQQLGFENFSARELESLGKGVTPEENIAAARLLYELHHRYGEAVEVFRGHGFILFTPWTTPEDLVTNLEVIAAEAPFLAGSISIGSRLVFYDPFNPIFRLAEEQGLVVRTPADYTLGFRFADPRTTEIVRLALALEQSWVAAGQRPSRRLSRAVLTGVVESSVRHPEPSSEGRFRAAERAAIDRMRGTGPDFGDRL
jgi:hypothetical protein